MRCGASLLVKFCGWSRGAGAYTAALLDVEDLFIQMAVLIPTQQHMAQD